MAETIRTSNQGLILSYIICKAVNEPSVALLDSVDGTILKIRSQLVRCENEALLVQHKIDGLSPSVVGDGEALIIALYSNLDHHESVDCHGLCVRIAECNKIDIIQMLDALFQVHFDV